MTTETLTPPHDADAGRPARRRRASARLTGMTCRNCGLHPADRPGVRLSGLFRAARGDLRPGRRRGHADARDDRAASAGHLAIPRAAPRRRGAGAVAAGRLDAAPRRRPPGPDARRRPALAQGRHPQPVAELQGPRRRDRRGPRRRVRRRRRSPAPRPATSPARRPPRRPRSGSRPTCSSRPTSSPPRSITPSPTARPSCRSTAPTTTSTASASRSPTRPAGASSTSTCGRSTPRAPRRSPTRSPRRSAGARPTSSSAPIASGAMFTRVARGFEELAELGLIERRPIRFVGGQAAGCAPVATAWEAGTDVIDAGPRAGHDRPLARHRQPGRRPLRGRARARRAAARSRRSRTRSTAAAIRDVARLEGSTRRRPAA